MLNNVTRVVKKTLDQKVELVRTLYKEFRLYDFGSYVLHRLTPRNGYTLNKNIAYGLKAQKKKKNFSAEEAREQRPKNVFVHGGA